MVASPGEGAIVVEPAGLRNDAIRWLAERTLDGQLSVTREDLADYRWDGEKFPLISTMQGIRRPAGWSATLSIRTAFRRSGETRPYEDEIGDDGLIRYKWRGDNPQQPENVGLRNAMHQRLPIIWFIGISMNPAQYQVISPVYILGEEPERQQFVMAPFAEEDYVPDLMTGSVMESSLKRYLKRETTVRLHQPLFRSTVLAAYGNHCSVCNFAHPELLDAAHIVPDREVHGLPTVTNGIALCKIHHAAFDRRFLGLRPTQGRPVVEIQQDLLDEVDGPMLRHGLQDLHGKPVMAMPKRRVDYPSNENLAWAYAEFTRAGRAA